MFWIEKLSFQLREDTKDFLQRPGALCTDLEKSRNDGTYGIYISDLVNRPYSVLLIDYYPIPSENNLGEHVFLFCDVKGYTLSIKDLFALLEHV